MHPFFRISKRQSSSRQAFCFFLSLVLYFSNGMGYGDWHSWDICPEGSFVTKFQNRVEKKLGRGMWADDTALNAIWMTCSDGTAIHSGKVSFGTWRSESSTSNSGFTGAALKVEGDQVIISFINHIKEILTSNCLSSKYTLKGFLHILRS